jgi:hypothetical protein
MYLIDGINHDHLIALKKKLVTVILINEQAQSARRLRSRIFQPYQHGPL